MRQNHLSVAVVLVLAATAFACGPPGEMGEPVDHQTVVDGLNEDVRSMSQSASQSVEFIENSDLIAHTADFATYSETCVTGPDGETTCEETSTDTQIDTNLEEPTNTLIEELEKSMFSRENIVSQTETTITYKPDAEYLCEGVTCATFDSGESRCVTTGGPSGADSPSETEVRQACQSNIRDLNARVQVWSPQPDELEFNVVFDSEHRPFDITLASDKVGTTVRLAELKGAIAHGDSVYDSTTAASLPDTFQGTISSMVEQQGAETLHFENRVQADVSVGEGDVQFDLASAGQPIFAATADGANESISTTFNLNTVEAAFPYTYTSPYRPDQTPPQEEVELQHLAHLSGLTGRIILEGGAEQLQVNNLSLGDSTTWLEIAGERVFNVDLNPNSGRSFDMTVEAGSHEDAFQASVDPQIQASIGLHGERISDQITWLEEWVKQDQFDLSLTGSEPTVEFGSAANDAGYLKVIDGSMELTSQSPAYTRTVQQGNCLKYEEGNATVSYYHPLNNLVGGSCPQLQ